MSETTTTTTTTTTERHDFNEKGATFSLEGGSKCGTCGEHDDHKVHDPAVKVTHVVIGQNTFYNGATLEAARAGFRREGGRLDRHHLVYEFPEGVTYLGVNMMGTMRWRYDTEPHVEPVVTEHHARKR